MKIVRSLLGITDVLDIDTESSDGELSIKITSNFDSPQAQTLQFAVRKDIAQLLIKSLFDGMRLQNPDETLPEYKVIP